MDFELTWGPRLKGMVPGLDMFLPDMKELEEPFLPLPLPLPLPFLALKKRRNLRTGRPVKRRHVLLARRICM